MTGFAFHLAAFGSSADLTDSMAQAVSVDLQAQSDERLVKLHVYGQPGAIDELIRRHRDELFGYLVRFTGSRALAEMSSKRRSSRFIFRPPPSMWTGD